MNNQLSNNNHQIKNKIKINIWYRLAIGIKDMSTGRLADIVRNLVIAAAVFLIFAAIMIVKRG
jgi:hypothetical protein